MRQSRSIKLKRTIERFPSVWRLAQYVRYRNSHRICRLITPTHNLVLEGFPRCGNSFAVRAFLNSNGRQKDWAIATHFHSIAQIALAVQWDRPVAVFIRPPRDAILSLAAHSVQKQSLRSTHESEILKLISSYLDYYIFFHEGLEQLVDHVVVSDFTVTTTDFSRVLIALNEQFKTDFSYEVNHEVLEKAVFDIGAKHLSPDTGRTAIKNQFSELLDRPRFASKLLAANAVYERVRHFALT